MTNSLNGHDYFPPEFVSPKAKEDNSYGLQYAKAMYNCTSRYGGTYHIGDSVHDDLQAVAQGNASVTPLQKLFNCYIDPQNPGNDGSQALAPIDIKILNLAPKYVNRAVGKMQKIEYEYGLEAVDLVSIEEREDYAAALDAFYRMRQWSKDMGYDPKVMFPEIDVDSLPEYPDEMMYDVAVHPKLKKEIGGELFIRLLQSMNNFSQKMRQVSWDLVVFGRAHLFCYHDGNGHPRVKVVNDKFWIGSYVENDDFEEQEYAGFYDFISVNQFIKETEGLLSLDKQLEIVSAHANKGSILGTAVDYRRLEDFDGLSYLPVLRFYFRSEDVRSYVQKKNQYGDKILVEKAYNYSPPPEVAQRFNENGDSRVIRNTYTSIYGGTWVIDSDVVYNYGRKDYPRQNLVNASLPIKTFATNFKEGRAVSFTSQMIEPLFMINAAWNKIKQILAEGRMGVMEIDFDQIEEVSLGSGNNKWTPLDVMKFFFKKQILIKRGKTNQHQQKIMNAIEMNTGGLTLADYFTAFTTGIQMLEQMTGTSAVEGVQIPDRLAVKNAEMSQMTADIDMEYLYNAREYLCKVTTDCLLRLGQQSLADGRVIQGYIPALGKVNTGFYRADRSIAFCEYGMFLSRKPTEQEWAAWYMDLSIALKEGRISVADSAFVRNIDNMKQAQQMLAIKETIYQRKLKEAEQQTAQLQMQANQQLSEQSIMNDLTKMREQERIDKELAILQGKIDENLLMLKNQNDMYKTSMIDRNKKVMSKQKSSDEIVRQAVRNIPEKERNQVHAAQVRVDAESVKVDLEKVKTDAKKPAPKK